MKKNISINIGGIIFHIEEDGYETLRKYLDSINAYFASFEDNSEILADIESRIAEIFLSKLSDGKQVITSEDVKSLINTMGSVSDFKAAEEQEAPKGESQKQAEDQKETRGEAKTSPHKRLYRDQKKKILGGVCSGLGHYFNIDPIWPRLLFALLVLGSYGSLLLIYFILWIVIPASAELEEGSDVKKMFRDPEKKVIGGVASGLAAFFGIDITLTRVLFVVFTIVGGLGFLVYVILWIALPEARTITEKMQMQGEPVTLSNIETTVKKSLNEKDSEEESLLAKIVLFPFRLIALIINGIAKALGPLFAVMVDILRIVFGASFVMAGLAVLISLIFVGGVLMGLYSPDHFLWWDVNMSGIDLPMEALRNAFPVWVIWVVLIAAIIPFLFITLLGASIIVKKIIFKPVIGWTLFVVFFLCIAVLSFKVPNTIYGFREEGVFEVENSYTIQGTPLFKLKEAGLEDYEVTSIRFYSHEGKDLRIVKQFEAQGRTRKIASENAQMVAYNITQEDSTWYFDSNITFNKGAVFSAQRLEVKVYVPTDQPFVVDGDLWELIDNYTGYYRRRSHSDETWKMTSSGMECISCGDITRLREKRENQYGLSDFDEVEISGIFDVQIERDDEFAVDLNGSQRQKEAYDIYVNGNTLVIDYKNDNIDSFWDNHVFDEDEIEITITLPHLEELDVKGAGKVRFRDFEEDNFEIRFLGAVQGDGRLEANSLTVSLTGASSLTLEGSGGFLETTLTGASGLRAYGYEVERAKIEARGASTAKVYVSETLDIDESMASKVSYRGDAKVNRH